MASPVAIMSPVNEYDYDPKQRRSSPTFSFRTIPPPSPPADRPFSVPPNRRIAMLRDLERWSAHQQAARSRRTKCLICLILLFVVLALVAVPATLLCVFGPRTPVFSIENVWFETPVFSEFSFQPPNSVNVTMRVRNPARSVGLFYEYDNSVVARYSGVRLCSGEILPFYQQAQNATSVVALLRGNGAVLSEAVGHKFNRDRDDKKIPINLEVRGTVKFKMGGVKLRNGGLVRVNCDFVVDGLNSTQKLISNRCESSLKFVFASIMK